MTDQALLEAVQTAIPHTTAEEVMSETGVARERRRKLSAAAGLLLVIAMNLLTCSLAQVLMKLLEGFRYVWPTDDPAPASKCAISQLRYELGVTPMAALFRHICQAPRHAHHARRVPVWAAAHSGRQ